MSLEAIVGIQSELRPQWKDHSRMATLDALKYEELEEGQKHLLPSLSIDHRLKLSNTIDEVTRQKIKMNFFKGTTTAAFRYKNGIVVCADSRATGGEFIFSGTVRKIIPINSYILGTMAGGAADCAYWERLLAEQCRLYELRNREPISVAAASKLLANMLYNYKGMGLSLGTMISGWDPKRGPQIFMVDNDARRLEGDMFSVGSGSVYAYGILDKEYRFDMTDEEAYNLGRRAIFHATHRDSASGGKVRIYAIHKDGWKVITEEDNSILYDRYAAEGSMSTDH